MDYRREHDRLANLARFAEKRRKLGAERRALERQRRADERYLDMTLDRDRMYRDLVGTPSSDKTKGRKMSDRTKCVLWAVGCFFAGGAGAALFKLMGG